MKHGLSVGLRILAVGVFCLVAVLIYKVTSYTESTLPNNPFPFADYLQQYSSYFLLVILVTLYFYHVYQLKRINRALDLEKSKTGEYLDLAKSISKKKFSEESIPYFAYYDVLTELPNRFLFENRLKHSLLQAERNSLHLPVLFLNLNRFKSVNESLGHNIGDLLLTQVADRLVDCVRESDTVAHMGGDEFTIIVEAVNNVDEVMRSATRIAHSILEAMSRPFDLEGCKSFISISMGIVFYPGDGKSAAELLKNADTAMHHAKSQGQNRYSFYKPQMNAAATKRLTMENDMRTGIEKGEFFLYYQPLLDLKSGSLNGAEALLRWQHPKLGEIPTAQFIPLAEESGLIVPLGEWVIAEAMSQAKEWLDKGLTGFRVAINISLHQAEQQELLQFVLRMLEEIGVPPETIVLELTESVFMADMDKIKVLLSELEKIGISLLIDDFGTGYSSLARLKELPASTIKIDQSFIRDLTLYPDNVGIIKAIITMAHSLHMTVVAEGIETVNQLTFLKGQGCDEAQGFLIGKPVSQRDFDALLVNKGLIKSTSMYPH